MRKIKYSLLLLLINCSNIFSQAKTDNLPILSEVITVDSSNKNQLYDKTKVWFVKSFKSSKDVIQLDDKENGKIIGKGLIKYEAPSFNPGTGYSGYFEFTLTVEVKDNKYKYAFEDIKHVSSDDEHTGGLLSNEKSSSTLLSKGGWKKIQETGYNAIKKSIESLKAAMIKKNDNW